MKRRIAALLLAGVLVLALAPAALAFDTDRDSGLLALVNKTHLLDAQYVPELTPMYGKVRVSTQLSLRPEAAEAYQAMYAAMAADGVTNCYILSGYRSYTTQRYLLARRVNDRVVTGMSYQRAYDIAVQTVAPEGASEHQTGLALDLNTGGGKLSDQFGATAPGKWLAEHGWEYGFILRYRGDKTASTMIAGEAWHFRYIGAPHAKLVTENGWCYEEYIDALQKAGEMSTRIGDTVYDIYWTTDTEREFPGREIEDISRDNAGGWIVTTRRPADPLEGLAGSWAEGSFRHLEELGVTFSQPVDPGAVISIREFGALCGLALEGDGALTREGAAVILAPLLPDQGLTRLAYSDLGDTDGGSVQCLQTAVTNGLYVHTPGLAFRPKAELTWGEAGVLAARFRDLVS